MAEADLIQYEETDEPILADTFDSEVEEDLPLEYDEDDPNLVEVFADHPEGRDHLKEIQNRILDNFNDDWEKSRDYREQMTEDWAIFSGDLPEKEFPFENSANLNVPLMLETMSRLAFRMSGEIFGDWNGIVSAVPIAADDRELSEAVSKHSNWQFREQIPDFQRQMDRAVLAFLVLGDVTCHSYFDEKTGSNRHEVLTPDEFVIPFAHSPTAPDLSDLPHYTKILHMYQHELEDKIGVWHGVDEVIDGEPQQWDSDPDTPMADRAAEAKGIEEPSESDSLPFKVLHYEGWMTLPNQDRQRWCQAFLDNKTGALMKLTIHEEPDWQDQLRYDNQLTELQAWEAQMDAWEEALLEKQDQLEAARVAAEESDADPLIKSDMVTQAEGIPVPMQPEPPSWLEDGMVAPDPPKRVPVRMFTRTVAIENLTGPHGMSMGAIQADFNRAANIMTSQFVDAATLANCWSLMTTAEVSFDDGFSMAPGKINKVHGVLNLQDSIREMKPSGANPQLMQAVENLYSWSQSSAQAPDVLSGESGKSGETYRGLSSRLEQATKQLSVMALKFVNTFLKQIVQNNARLNSIFLDEDELIRIADPRSMSSEPMRISRDIYRRNYSFVFRADLRFASEAQRIQEAQELLQVPQMYPPLAQNAAFMYASLKKLLEARKQYDMIPLLGPPPDAQQVPPFGAMPQQPQGGPQGGQPGGQQ